MHQFSGKSQRGNGRGRTLGFPTANIVLDDPTLRPGAGIYAGWVTIDDQAAKHLGVLHVGPRPTYNDPTLMVEIHLLDFPDRDLYGHHFHVQGLTYIRDIKKFESEADLMVAITADCEAAREILSKQKEEL